MKRILLLISFVCLFAIVSVMANEGAAYTAATEPVLSQQSLGQYFGIGEVAGVPADPSEADFSFLALYPSQDEVFIEMNLNGTVSINQTAGQMIFTDYSPGITVIRKPDKRFSVVT
jgi:hypothetical protein